LIVGISLEDDVLINRTKYNVIYAGHTDDACVSWHIHSLLLDFNYCIIQQNELKFNTEKKMVHRGRGLWTIGVDPPGTDPPGDGGHHNYQLGTRRMT